MFRQQCRQTSGCSGCVTIGCARQNSCDMTRCIKQCEIAMARVDPETKCQNSEQEELKCNRRCQRNSYQILSNCLRKLENEYQPKVKIN